MDNAYKGQLQSYALKQNLELPVYITEREGPPHALRFRSKVTFCGQTYQSNEFFPTLKASEHAAAKLALDSLTAHSPEVVDVAYKNMLQEMAQKQNYLLPVYATCSTGPTHSPTFVSTVEFDGRVFRGEEAKTKKMAEMNAAKVAIMSIKYGHMNQTPSPPSPSLPCVTQKATNSNAKSITIPSQASKIVVTPDVPSKWIEVYDDDCPNPLTAVNDGKKVYDASSSIEVNIDASLVMLQNHPTKNVNEEDSENKLIMGTGHLSIPNGQRVVCRPWNSEMTLPQDAEMVFRDDRFIAYRLLKP